MIPFAAGAVSVVALVVALWLILYGNGGLAPMVIE